MTERIITAMDYHIDSITKAIPKPFKQRMLGDIDGKYSVTDPLLDVSYQAFPDPCRKLDDRTEEKTIHQPLAGTVFRGIEEDLERLIRSPERARSSTARTRSARLNSPSSRPLTSVSQASGLSSAIRRRLGNLPDSLSKFTTHASIKRLAFTSPAIKVGAVDVRDEVTDEIVNKPMTLRWGNLKAQSAPPGGRARSNGPRCSSAARSAKWTSVSSTRRAKTSYSKRRCLRAKPSEKIPGPFMTVKVPERDMWVVSNSTPTTFFDDGDITSRGQQLNGMKDCVKFANWENTAESVPKEEQSSPPRHERILGAPAQFSPKIKWLRYDHSAPPKKPPVLTPFKGTLDGRYYHLETEQCKKVNHHINASPGVRIARNGEVVSHSMKIESLAGDDDTSAASESESDAGVSSLIPAKLAEKIKQHYGTPENESDSDYEEESSEEETDYEGETGRESSRNGVTKTSTEAENSEETTNVDPGRVASENTTLPEIDREDSKDIEQTDNDDTEVSSMSDDGSVESADHEPTELTKGSVALLDRITGHNQPNPFIDSSEQTSSTTSYDSHEMEGYLDSLGVKVDFVHAGNDFDKESDVWRVLENVNPTFWVSQSRHKKLAILRRLRKQGEVEHNARSAKELASSAKTKSEALCEEVIIPLCWEDELAKADRIVKGRHGIPTIVQKCDSSALPIVYHKGHRNHLPTATVASSIKHPMIEKSKSTRPSQSVNFNIKLWRGYKVPMSTPRSIRSDRTTSVGNSRQTSASSSRERKIMDLAELLQVTQDSLPSKTSPIRTHSVTKDQVTIVLNNGIGGSHKNAGDPINRDATHASQSMNGEEAIGNESRRVQQTVESLDFTRLDVDSAGDSNLQSSQRFSDLKSSELTSPQNTPTTPFSHYHSSNGFAQRNPAAGQSDSKRLGDRESNIDHPTSKGSRPMSVFAYDESKGFGNKLHVKSPNRGAPNADPNEYRPKASRMPTLHHNSAGSKLLKTSTKLNVSSSNDFTDTNLIVPSVQLRAPSSPNASAMKTADFIQITQSLHIRDRPIMESDRSSLTGNKMYDSYMHELAVQSAERRDEPIDDKGVVGRGLGGNSGKGGIPPLPRSVRKNLASCQTSQQSPNILPFTPQAGRRSGLTMVPQDGSRRIGPFGLGVKGDQVRLNIDKNIHNIYRDLGVLKSPGRPHISSAKSQSSQKDDITVTIPSVTPSERDAKLDSPRSEQAQEVTSEAKPSTRPSSSNPAIAVQDSGTQWSSRSVKPEDDTQQEMSLHGHSSEVIHSAEQDSTSLTKERVDRNNEVVESKPMIDNPTPEQTTTATMESLKTDPETQPVNSGNADEASDDAQSEDNDIRGVTRVTVNMQPE